MKGRFAKAARSPRAAAAHARRTHATANKLLSAVAFVLALAAGEPDVLGLEPEMRGEIEPTDTESETPSNPEPPPGGSEVTADWPGCGGVCALWIGVDFLLLDLSEAEPPEGPLQLTLTLSWQESDGREWTLSVDVSDCLEDEQLGTWLLDTTALAPLGGAGALRSAFLSWEEPSTLGSGGETLPISR